MQKLVEIAPPHVAAVTTIALQHATQFPEGLKAIAAEKGVIFSHRKTCLGFVNADNAPSSDFMQKGSCRKITFSLQSSADYHLEQISSSGSSSRVRLTTPSSTFEVELNLPLKVHYQNFLVAAAIAHELGVPPLLIQGVAPTLKLPPMCYEIIQRSGITFINDAYNANPDAMSATLMSLSNYTPAGRKIAVLTEMNDLGPFSEMAHRQVASVALQQADSTFLLGARMADVVSLWQGSDKRCYHFMHREALIEALKAMLRKGDLVALKGARAHALEKVLEHF